MRSPASGALSEDAEVPVARRPGRSKKRRLLSPEKDDEAETTVLRSQNEPKSPQRKAHDRTSHDLINEPEKGAVASAKTATASVPNAAACASDVATGRANNVAASAAKPASAQRFTRPVSPLPTPPEGSSNPASPESSGGGKETVGESSASSPRARSADAGSTPAENTPAESAVFSDIEDDSSDRGGSDGGSDAAAKDVGGPPSGSEDGAADLEKENDATGGAARSPASPLLKRLTEGTFTESQVFLSKVLTGLTERVDAAEAAAAAAAEAATSSADRGAPQWPIPPGATTFVNAEKSGNKERYVSFAVDAGEIVMEVDGKTGESSLHVRSGVAGVGKRVLTVKGTDAVLGALNGTGFALASTAIAFDADIRPSDAGDGGGASTLLFEYFHSPARSITSWSCPLPRPEQLCGVACGSCFVAAFSTAPALRLFANSGVLLEYICLGGRPLLCAARGTFLLWVEEEAGAAGAAGGCRYALFDAVRREFLVRGPAPHAAPAAGIAGSKPGGGARAGGRGAAPYYCGFTHDGLPLYANAAALLYGLFPQGESGPTPAAAAGARTPLFVWVPLLSFPETLGAAPGAPCIFDDVALSHVCWIQDAARDHLTVVSMRKPKQPLASRTRVQLPFRLPFFAGPADSLDYNSWRALLQTNDFLTFDKAEATQKKLTGAVMGERRFLAKLLLRHVQHHAQTLAAVAESAPAQRLSPDHRPTKSRLRTSDAVRHLRKAHDRLALLAFTEAAAADRGAYAKHVAKEFILVQAFTAAAAYANKIGAKNLAAEVTEMHQMAFGE